MDNPNKLFKKLQEFSEINSQFKQAFRLVQEDPKLKAEQKCEYLLDYIAQEILPLPQNFDQTFRKFSDELPKLLFALISQDKHFQEGKHLLKCILLANVVKRRNDLQMYAINYFQTHPSIFKLSDTVALKKRKSAEFKVNDLDILEAAYFLLKSNPDFYRNKWKWSMFIKKYFEYSDPKIRWVCCQIVGILWGFHERKLNDLIQNVFKDSTEYQFLPFTFEKHLTLNDKVEPITVQQTPLLVKPQKTNIVCISGIYLPILSDSSNLNVSMVEVPSTYNNLRKICLGLTSNKAICLQGPVGSGKTTLLEYLAQKTGRNLGENFIKVQLGDQTDSKMLLGTYRCTDVPGEFVWQPGVLTQAVLEGHWILLEDIDSASLDIASVLTSLLENKSLTVPGYRDSVHVSSGFQLFVTQRLISTISGHHKKHSNTMTLLEKHLLQINIDPLTANELRTIVNTQYKQFLTISERMINVFLLFCQDSGDHTQISIPKSGRQISTRDFFKWCFRAVIDFDVQSQESALKVLQDAIDVFCCSYSNSEEALELARQISTNLGIINQKAEFFFKNYKPHMKLTSDSLVAGRVSLPRTNNEFTKSTNFSFTRPSAVLLERIMCCINLKEPVLLIGETGTGKTSCVQYLANTVGQKLIVINMNQQSDSADLLGGFKPVDLKFIISPIRREFEVAFADFFKVEPNRKYLSNIAYCFNNERWLDLVKLMNKSCQAAVSRLVKLIEDFKMKTNPPECDITKNNKDRFFLNRWQNIGEKLHKLELQLKQKTSLAFAFIEGSLVKAVENGYWVLLDEINLANAETLECLSGLLEGSQGSLCLLERGDKKPVKRHPNFTLFACMNPSTDVGKKDLPAGLRNRFTEFFVDELNEKNDLLLLVGKYLETMSLKVKELERIVDFYLKVRKETVDSLMDGLGHKPHFSLRSLCRALMIASKNPCGMFKRNLYEAFCLSFLTQLDSNSYITVENLIKSYIIGDQKSVKAVLKQPIPKPVEGKEEFLQFEGYWVKKGSLESVVPEEYILTESVRKNLKDLVRVVSIGKLPVLLQGDTSVGKTSLITYLAKSSGNKCVRINNHEHTDLQEYVGSYVADTEGKLVFREGLLVEAMRKGHWIILDELNLAPTDVLEALNRVLDDNRELFIPETQETVKANPNFMLFATQNPPGAYGGRKMLSRAFRNRFVELHFNEIPSKELEFILHQRCQMPLSYAKKMINVMTDLQMRRRGSAAFAGKHGFITLRDLFRWGERYRLADNTDKLYDWDQHLADEGYLVLAGRVRKIEEKQEIIEVLQKHLKREVIPDVLFTLSDKTSAVTKNILNGIEENKYRFKNIVWTFSMRQLAVLVSKALQFKEPVLLVGETGGGKTTVCQLIAENNGQELLTVNCHMHSESGDFIGGLRPVRDHSDADSTKLFEWVDGPLIKAMVEGQLFLVDEISLADDSVLERLNSLLEPERTLLLAEKGIDLNNINNSEQIVAHSNFFFIGTMNPGGDFGKKELSPALRNRFTEVWCESCKDRQDLVAIIEQNLQFNSVLDKKGLSEFANKMMDFVEWFENTEIGKRVTMSIRDILTWVNFMNICCNGNVSANEAYFHGATMTFLDGLGTGTTGSESLISLDAFKKSCINFVTEQLNLSRESSSPNIKTSILNNKFGVQPFYIDILENQFEKSEFYFNSPTVLSNLLRLLRGMQLNKAILLEGSPGVGKTSLVMALAKCTGHKVFRVNLSDQTDISDLFGADLPVEGGKGGEFSWRDGPLLQALQSGSWILLDELNLASQSVLEGLNACLDHRGEIFIPELGKTFHVKPGTKFFACQNPVKQGGSRRGLPKSFLNRFIQVYVDPLQVEDFYDILRTQFKQVPEDILRTMITFHKTIENCLESHKFGHKGAPWECNLRDLTRWCEAMIYHHNSNHSSSKTYQPESVVNLVYGDRMRTLADKQNIRYYFKDNFKCDVRGVEPVCYVTQKNVYIGDINIERHNRGVNINVLQQDRTCLVLRSQLPVLRSLTYCVKLNWMTILVGSSGTGKNSVVRTLAHLSGKTLKTLPVTSAMDTTDLLGGFEQTDYGRHLEEIARETERLTFESLQELLIQAGTGEGAGETAVKLLMQWESYQDVKGTSTQTMNEEVKLFLRKTFKLQELLDTLKVLPQYEKDNTIKTLTDKINIISDSVKIDGSLNAGGKFEWVDSMLVKCLQDGSWLLIDNVNLCSSAVLDRLNALLEPRGFLTISERGVNKNGQMVEIKPHPDFRLFLTMDPKNGEISRAMRNRGVEIYLLKDSEMVGTDNKFDIMSLIHLEGLQDTQHIVILLKLHDFLSDLILGEKPQISDILQAASLISQQLNHGVDLLEAFSSTLIEVYYKTRPSIEFKCNETVTVIRNKIEEIIQNELSTDELTQQTLFSEDVTLKSQNIERCSVVEKINQQAVVLNNYLQSSKSENYFLNFLNSCINFFTMSSVEDLTKIDLFYRALINKHPNLSRTRALVDSLQILPHVNTDLPLDLKWVPNNTYEDQYQNKCNLILQIFKHSCLKHGEEHPKGTKPKSGCMSLLNYMQEIKKQKLESTHSALIVEYERLSDAYRAYLLKIAHEIQELNDENFIHLLHLLYWEFAFFKHTLKNIKRMDDAQQQNFHLEFSILYKWFCKYAVKELSTTTRIDLNEDLEAVINYINEKLQKDFSGFRKMCRRYQKTSNEFLLRFPFDNNEKLDNYRLCTEINKYYNICDKRNDSIRIISIFKQMKELRPMLINIKKYQTLENDEITNFVQDLKLMHGKAKEVSCSNPPLVEFQILPILDVFLQMQVKSMSGNIESLVKNILFPTNLSGALGTKCQLADDALKLYYLYIQNSISSRPSKYLGRSVEGSEINLNSFAPKITYFLSVLLSNNKERSNMVTLGNYRELVKQHSFLNCAVWSNIYQLSEKKYDYLSFEKQNLSSVYQRFIEEFTKCIGITYNTNTSIESLLENITDAIKNKKDDPILSDPDNRLDTLLKHLEICRTNFLTLSKATDINEKLFLISDLYTELSCVKLTLNSELPLIDPIIKKAKKKHIISSSIECFEKMKEGYILQNKCLSNSTETIHPHFNSITNEVAFLTKTCEKFGYDRCVDAVRLKDVHYNQVVMVVKHAFNSILSDMVAKHLPSLNYLIRNLTIALLSKNHINYKYFVSKLPQYESYIITYENLLHEWTTVGEGYPDVMDALLENLAEFLYGYQMKVELLKKLLIDYEHMKIDVDINNLLLSLVKFPVLDEEQDNYLKHFEIINSSTISELILNVLKGKASLTNDKTDIKEQAKQAHITLLKIGLHETFNLCILEAKNSDILNKELFKEFSNFVDIFLTFWNKQQENEEIKQKEAESLYKTRTKCDDESEDKQLDEELKELFPNYHDIDFADFQASTNQTEDLLTKPPEDIYKISYDDLKFIVNLHSILMKNYTKTEWLNPAKDKNIRHDFISPLMEKYKVFSLILEEAVNGLDYKLDSKLIGSLNVLLAVAQRYGDTSDLSDQPTSPSKNITKKTNDFYKDSNVEEVKNSYHILEELKMKITEFLQEWPDQPTLKTILEVIERIYAFDINSPISRFLTGFEILLTKCHEWEEVAHSGVSLGQFYKNLIDQIIVWRKLELSMWKDLLNRTYSRLNESLSKWWIYLYNIMLQFVVEKQIDKKQLVESLQLFIVKSNLAEFQGRLELLYIFHCHATYLHQSQESQIFINVLWNLYSYFQQFEQTVSNKIKDLRSPIEKKLKDYVKIVRWKDINYWSVKETVDKSHKILHKFVREFQETLQQPVTPCLTNIQTKAGSENVGIWDRPQRQNPKTYHYSLDADCYIVKQSLFKKHQIEPIADEHHILNKSESYFMKSRKICKEIISATEYPNLVQNLDSFVTEIIETSTHLQNLEVDTSLPKDKQKSQAKNILQQKRRVLADLFKTLSKIGLSFRSGIVQSKLKNPTDDYYLKPLDLSANFSHINYGSTEEKILTIWDSCEIYYVRSLMRASVLDTALVSPAKDLGLQNVERCKGFTYDLLDLTQRQKVSLTESSRVYYYLRYYIKQINSFCEGKDFLHISVFDNINNLVKNIRVVMNQYKIILNTCPEDEFLEHNYEGLNMPILDSNLGSRITCKSSTLWSRAVNLIDQILNSANKIKVLIVKCRGFVPCAEFNLVNPTFMPISDNSALKSNLAEICTSISELKNIFSNMPLTNSLLWLENEVNKSLNEKRTIKVEQVSTYEYAKKSKKLIAKILVVMQNIYRKYCPVESIPEKEIQAESKNEVTENHLRDEHLNKLLLDNLSSDINTLEMPNILKKTHKLTALLVGSPSEVADNLKPLAYHFLPILEQLVQTFQFFLTQQVSAYRVTCKMSSILLNIFIELASKGFCVPPEFSDEMDSEGVSKPSDGLGLGEGEGERDVSDKIESEDQLEEAQPADQEKNQEVDQDCKEDDKGIEMSEDFDSKLQDKEKKDGDNDDVSSDESDAEEQMGETEKGADQLDQEIWGSDKEEEAENDDSEQKEEKGNKGEMQGDEQLGAKDEKSVAEDEQNDPDASDEQEKNKKDINELEEPEYDDDQVDPHHGKQPELPEPEPMDLPDDLQLDEGQGNEDQEKQDENPFDIDAMMEENKSDDKPVDENQEVKPEEQQNDEIKDFSSDEEDVTKEGDAETENKDTENIDESKKPEENKNEETVEAEDNLESQENEGTVPDQTQSLQENIEAMEVDNSEAADKAESTQSIDQKSNQPIEELCQEDQPDKEGVGQSQMEESKTGHSAQTTAVQEMKTAKRELEEDMVKQRPGESDSQRSLGDVNQPVKKKLKTIDAKENKNGNEEENNEYEDAEMFQHIKDAKESSTQVLDAATEEQVESQKKDVPNKEDEEAEKPTEMSDDLVMEQESKDEDELEVKDNIQAVEVEKSETNKTKKRQHPEGEILGEMQDIEIEGDVVETSTVQRNIESTHHTQYSNIIETTATRLTVEEINNLRSQVEKQLSTWNESPGSVEAEEAWQRISSVTSSLAQDLSEQLRLILEPTQASRLKGDFRTGRRINMRKVIPYIASQFRKDKIWLRRTKPSKREYQIVIAIDDSSSMADNHSKELAFESVSLISKALTLLESGQLSVISFGEEIEIIHKLVDQFTDRSGVKLLQQFKFNQNKTYVAKLVDFATEMLNQTPSHSNALNAKLLIIVSDGRGVFSEGETNIRQTVRRAKLSNIFMVFVIIDSPENKNSILDIRMPVFKDGKLLYIQSYMDVFPFSFYIILRDINSLPNVLSDALRQWFEIVCNLDK